MQYKVDFDAIPWETPAPAIRDKSCQLNGTKLRLVEYSREMEPHWCTKGHVGYVLSGSMEITVGGQVLTYEAGDGVFLPPGEEHKHKARILTDVVKVIFVEDA
ncbi:MAG: cupin domain-containing protein [Phycisphaerales bacterium]|nr:MAG: cupin domain-containing protein [Phycisphaerales bacterium]